MKEKIKSFFFIMDGKKEILNVKKIKMISFLFLILFTVVELLWPKEHSRLSRSHTQFLSNNSQSDPISRNHTSIRADELINSHQLKYENTRRNRKGQSQITLKVPVKINFNAKQVLTRSGLGGTMKPLPSGTNFIGQLLSGIDTRNENQIIRVVLPYGAKHRSGGTIPKNTILLGNVSSNAHSEKVYISFDRAIFPNGKEYQLSAQALSSRDYSAGLTGEFHGNTDLRVAASMGLTMVSAASSVLTTKTTMGGIDQAGQQTIVPEATMRNAMLQGVSEVSEQESKRQAQNLVQKEDYLTVEAGADLIICLLSPFKGEKL